MHLLNWWIWQSSAGGKAKKELDLHRRITKKLWDLVVSGPYGNENGNWAKDRRTGWKLWRYPKSISTLWQKTDLFLIQIFSLNRIKLNIEGLENPSELGTVILFWIWRYGQGSVLNTEGIGFNPLSSHFREPAGRIIALKRH